MNKEERIKQVAETTQKAIYAYWGLEGCNRVQIEW